MAQRIIKFRGKHITTGEWLFGNYFNDGGEQYILPSSILTIDNYEKFQVDGNTVGQYSGLQDKNGTDIYEDDIVEFELHRYVCKFAKGGFYFFDVEDNLPTLYVTTIIGNIHDNKELLK